MTPEALFLVVAVAGVGVLHTIVPDHWVPLALIARQRGWSTGETASAAFQAGIGHVLSTLAIGIIVWLAGVAFAMRFGSLVDTAASLALVAFGGWIAISALHELRGGRHGHGHGHRHGYHGHSFSRLGGNNAPATADAVHGPELERIVTGQGILELSIFEEGVPPRFRLTGAAANAVRVETRREDGARQVFRMADRGAYWEAVDEIPEPHDFAVTVTLDYGDHAHAYAARFAERGHGGHGHDHGHRDGRDEEPAADPLYAPLHGGVAVLARHAHVHRHGSGPAHVHLHDHDAASAHLIDDETNAAPPLHVHRHKTTLRTALLIILGSSPMVEGIPAFFAAGRYGVRLVIPMALVFAISTIATYVLLCVYSAAGLQRLRFGSFERYGEVLSGAFIALVGVAFWIWSPVP